MKFRIRCNATELDAGFMVFRIFDNGNEDADLLELGMLNFWN